MATPELFQFSLSHFNEKGRWALDYKGIPHVRHSLVPGPHKPKIQRISGQGMVPVLRDGTTVVAGSNEIVAFLERTHPSPPLYPADPAVREKALAIQSRFDEEVGPAIRLALFHEIFRAAPGYFARIFTWDQQPWIRAVYRVVLPGVRRVVSSQYGIDDESARRARERTRDALDFVAREAGPRGYLAGDQFSVADLAAASLLSLATRPPNSQMPFPEPLPPVMTAWFEGWRGHPGVAWVDETYRRHRGVSQALPV